MKHRSVIAFVIVAAALFAAPQLSHDLQSLRSGLGMRLRGELLQAFLSMHTEEGGAAVAAPSARGAQALLASCTKAKPEAAPAKATKKSEPRAAVEQTEETASPEPALHLAMLAEPAEAPDVWKSPAVRAHLDAVGEAVASRGELPKEVAMIVPPDASMDPPPPPPIKASAAAAKANASAALKREEVEALRHVTFVATGFDGRQVNIQGPDVDALRRLSEALPGSFEFRLEGNGSKPKTMKFINREGGRPATAAPAPRAQRLPGAVACAAVAPAPVAELLSAGE
ncbi:MAG TPA: hypothetical protein VNZ44_06755 [Pyrinomonadaceae bacterium]|nr:hypothetical protein [Pyrinomonadaceae bacterium]